MMQQQPSPNIASPSTSFLSPRSSPLFAASLDQENPNTPYEYKPGDNNNNYVQYQQESEEKENEKQAPPKQVAQAMERLAQAGRLVAQFRMGGDRFTEALFTGLSLKQRDPDTDKVTVQLIASEEASMRNCLEELRTLGRTLEASGVMIGALQRLQESPSWGLHMPLVCPDGAVVAYAWKRQLAGQAAASAVDRTRLALKAFTDQKRRFFPHLEEHTLGNDSDGEIHSTKRPCTSLLGIRNRKQDIVNESDQELSLSDVLKCVDADAPAMKISIYQRLEWFKKASSLALKGNSFLELSKQEQSQPLAKLGTQTGGQTISGSVPLDQISVLDVYVPSVFRAIISLTPAGSTIPDAVAFFSPDEVGSYMHARGVSIHNIYQQMSKYGEKVLQYFVRVRPQSSLDLLLRWLNTYQSLFTKPCSKCERILAMDQVSALLLPPVIRPHQDLLLHKNPSSVLTTNAKDPSTDVEKAFHVGCLVEEEYIL
ncbi:hypothetical protein SUGI_0995240 [Cryptomeria japonica]|uniref:mediator of RNA polymerase II transcription subunit 27 isoform X1 n=1 Tax=Cryptomeria japonica TaxID=3369 RepID=UPI002414B8C0|nr:mediator of RNA polymerase II transcription subunit 27 isoform X1 [Cryptomeria japonica]GLJ47137.1 hypothetical protein SUGI_0995240 [Cryptomeria japonica]